MRISSVGLDLIRRWEGEQLTSYLCPAGKWTIGVGHTGSDVHPHQVITRTQSDQLLTGDCARAEVAIHNLVHVALTQNEYDALVSLVFNIGVGAFAKSTLLRRLNVGDTEGAGEQFLEGCHVSGRVSSGLLARRRAEAALFAKP